MHMSHHWTENRTLGQGFLRYLHDPTWKNACPLLPTKKKMEMKPLIVVPSSPLVIFDNAPGQEAKKDHVPTKQKMEKQNFPILPN